MSSDFDPLQAWPKPVQTPYPLNGRWTLSSRY